MLFNSFSEASLKEQVRLNAIGHLSPEDLKSQACKRKAEYGIQSYAKPHSTFSDIVAVLECGCLPPGLVLLPSWDQSLDIPLHGALAERALEPPTKRRNHSPSLEASKLAFPSKPSSASLKILNSEQTELSRGNDGSALVPPSEVREHHLDKVHKQHDPSNSDHLTATAFPLFVTDAHDAPSSVDPADHGQPLHPQDYSSTEAPVCTDAIRGPAQAMDTPSTSVQAGTGNILPSSFLSNTGPGSFALAGTCIDLEDLQMPILALPSSSDLTDEKINEIINVASELKRSGDSERGSRKYPWRVGSLSKYVEASLMYMEACESMLLLPKSSERSARASSLYGKTADLLVYAAKEAGFNTRGAELGKNALRILCERLAAICLMREAVQRPSKFHETANRVLSLLQAQKKYQHPSSIGQHPVTPSPQKQEASEKVGEHSPDGSTVSSRVEAAGISTPMAPHQQQQVQQHSQMPASLKAELGQAHLRLIAAAQKVSRFSDMMRRSTNGFQQMIERPDLRSNPYAM
eukprot:gene17684-24038_t